MACKKGKQASAREGSFPYAKKNYVKDSTKENKKQANLWQRS